MFRIKLFLASLLLTTNLFGVYEYDEPNLGNISLEAGIWQSSLSGTISNNTPTNVDFKDDLGFDSKKNITSFGLDVKNNMSWLPNININYFLLDTSSDAILNSVKRIDGENFINSISTFVEYSELNTIMYGYFQQNVFEFDIGVNIKKINYKQRIKENSGAGDIIITGPGSFIPLAYIAFKADIRAINTVLKVDLSTLSVGNNEAESYSYSLNYRIFRNMYLSYGYRYNSWKATNKNSNLNEKYKIKLNGNYFNIKVLF